MNKLVLVVFCGILAGVAAKDYPGHYRNFEDCYEKSKTLFDGSEQCSGLQSSTTVDSTSTDASTTTAGSSTSTVSGSQTVSVFYEETEAVICHCQMSEYLYSISLSLRDTEFYTLFMEWFIQIQIECMGNSMYTKEQKFIYLMSSMKKLCKKHKGMDKIFMKLQLGDFGTYTQLVQVSAQYQMESTVTAQLFVLSGESCAFFEAYLQSEFLTVSQKQALEVMFADIRLTVLAGQFASKEEQTIEIYKRFRLLFAQYPEWKEAFESVEISGFGCGADFFSLAETYFQISTMELQVGGDAASCAFIQGLINVETNVSYDIGFRLQIKNMKELLIFELQSTSVLNVKLEKIMMIMQQFKTLEGFFFDEFCAMTFTYVAEGVEYTQTYGEFCYQAYIKYKYDIEYGLGASTTSTAPVTTSTAAATTSPSVVCDATTLNTIYTNDPALDGYSIFIYSLNTVLSTSTWSASCKSNLNPIIKRCHNYNVNMTVNGSTGAQKSSVIFDYLSYPASNNAVCLKAFMSVQITYNGIVYGRICDLASCTQKTSSYLAC